MGTDEELDRLLRVADPVPGGVPGTSRLLERLAEEVTRGRRRRHTRRFLVGSVAALLSLTAGGVAFGDSISAYTGWFGPRTSESDESEWLRTDAPDYRQAVERLVPSGIPLPADYSWAPRTDMFVEQGREQPSLKQATGIRGEFALYAQCTWRLEWMSAHRLGDAGRADHAVRALREAPGWAELAAIDGGGVRDGIRQVAEAAARGDAEFVGEAGKQCADAFGEGR
ncbi:hypothetical protein AB0M02_39430 [Actinoplanes sp. NPDC051861]|uniref:hypothetical protein n=1 Tax=Actinoplanes sp. NPDC051861 TaxID=3155170 RepID=UPI0034158A3B